MRRLLLVIAIALAASPLQAQSSAELAVAAQSAEQLRWYVDRNVDGLASRFHERLVVLHANGMTRTKDETLAGLRSGQPAYNRIDVSDASVRIAGTTAVLIGKARFVLTINDEQRTYDRLYTEVYVQEGGKWLLFAGQYAAAPAATASAR